MKKRILSLDISASSTGWSFFYNGSLEYGVITTIAKHSTAKRLLEFRKALKKLLKRFKPTDIVVEDIFSSKNVNVFKLLAKFAGVAEELCKSFLDVEPCIIHNNTVKSYYKVKKKTELFEFMLDIMEWPEERFNFKKHNDIIDSIAQLFCYSDVVVNYIRFRQEKDYGYLYGV